MYDFHQIAAGVSGLALFDMSVVQVLQLRVLLGHLARALPVAFSRP